MMFGGDDDGWEGKREGGGWEVREKGCEYF